MAIGDVISQYPDTIHVFFRHGLGCVGCAVVQERATGQGAEVHGIDVDLLMKDLNDTVLVAQNN